MESDLYSEWLGVPAGPRPPDHFTLLGLKPGTRDPAEIERAAYAQLDKLDVYALTPDRTRREACQRIMNEVAKARLALIEAAARQDDNEKAEAGKPKSSSATPASTTHIRKSTSEPRQPKQESATFEIDLTEEARRQATMAALAALADGSEANLDHPSAATPGTRARGTTKKAAMEGTGTSAAKPRHEVAQPWVWLGIYSVVAIVSFAVGWASYSKDAHTATSSGTDSVIIVDHSTQDRLTSTDIAVTHSPAITNKTPIQPTGYPASAVTTAPAVADASIAIAQKSSPNADSSLKSSVTPIAASGSNSALTEAEVDRRVIDKLKQTVLSGRFSANRLENVIDYIIGKSDANVIIGWNALQKIGVDGGRSVTLSFTNASADQLLTHVLEQVMAESRDKLNPANWQVIGGIVVISTKNELGALWEMPKILDTLDNRIAAIKLKAPISIDFDCQKLGFAIDQLQKATGLRITAKWDEMQNVGIDQNQPITLKLNRIAADKAISIIAWRLSPVDDKSSRIIWNIIDGAVVVSTASDIPVLNPEGSSIRGSASDTRSRDDQ